MALSAAILAKSCSILSWEPALHARLQSKWAVGGLGSILVRNLWSLPPAVFQMRLLSSHSFSSAELSIQAEKNSWSCREMKLARRAPAPRKNTNEEPMGGRSRSKR